MFFVVSREVCASSPKGAARRSLFRVVLKSVAAFGLAKSVAVFGALAAPASAPETAPVGGSRFFGKIESINRSGIVLALRSGQNLPVDVRAAVENDLSVVLYVGGLVEVEGNLSRSGLAAQIIRRAKRDPASWGQDIR
jgi:hypothetical protein